MAAVAIDVRSETLLELVDADLEVEQLGTGFVFTEGPIWNPEERFLLYSDIPAGIRRRWSEEEGVVEVMRPSGKCNGMTYDGDLNLLVCEHVTSSLVRERRGGLRETLASRFRGKELNSPNDVIVRSDGSIYFSDPWYGRMPVFGLERERELGFQGVYRIPPGDGELELVVAEGEFEMPNGLCFSPDESLVYIGDTPRAHIKVFDLKPEGSLANGRIFFEGIGTGAVGDGVPDGMKCDERGNVWVSGPAGVWVISPEEEHLGVVPIPENVANLTWGGPDWKWLFVSASTSLYRISTKVGPRREPYMRREGVQRATAR